jgi:hypothetical protein
MSFRNNPLTHAYTELGKMILGVFTLLRALRDVPSDFQVVLRACFALPPGRTKVPVSLLKHAAFVALLSEESGFVAKGEETDVELAERIVLTSGDSYGRVYGALAIPDIECHSVWTEKDGLDEFLSVAFEQMGEPKAWTRVCIAGVEWMVTYVDGTSKKPTGEFESITELNLVPACYIDFDR